jgi:hypothetical protein
MGPKQKKKTATKQTQIVSSFKKLAEVDLLRINLFLLMIQSMVQVLLKTALGNYSSTLLLKYLRSRL